jgi:hypothetical protein
MTRRVLTVVQIIRGQLQLDLPEFSVFGPNSAMSAVAEVWRIQPQFGVSGFVAVHTTPEQFGKCPLTSSPVRVSF